MSSKPLFEAKIDDLWVGIYPSNEEMGQAAAREAAQVIQSGIQENGIANVIIATGNSQMTFLKALRELEEIDWLKVNIFHMDEYVGIDPQNPASFPQFLRRHFIDYVRPKAFYPVPANAEDLDRACADYEQLLRAHPANLCALGIGENGHLAFNDPPFVDFNDPAWVKVIKLAEATRRQQVGEGHFRSLEEVPTHAMTLTIPALIAARRVLAIVPEARKAAAVYRALRGPISEDCPGSILRRVPHANLFLDQESASEVYASVI